jgi:hypothetical protein
MCNQTSQQSMVNNLRAYWSPGYTYLQPTNVVTFCNANPTNVTIGIGEARGFTAAVGTGPGNNNSSTLGAYTYTGSLNAQTLNLGPISGAAPPIYGSVTSSGVPVFTVNGYSGAYFAVLDNGGATFRVQSGSTLNGFLGIGAIGGHVSLQFQNSAFAGGGLIHQTATTGQLSFGVATTLSVPTDQFTLNPTSVNINASGTAVSGTNYSSFLHELCGSYFNVSALQACWTTQNVVATGTNPTSNYVFINNGPNGGVVQVPGLAVLGTASFGSSSQTSMDAGGNGVSATASWSMLNENVTGSFGANTAKTTVNCSTSGTAVFAEPQTGGSDKKVKAYLTACVGTASYTYPTPFLQTPAVVTMTGNAVTASIVTAISSSAMTVTGTTTTGFLVIEGW